MYNVEEFYFNDIFRLAKLFEVEDVEMMKIIYQQYRKDLVERLKE